MGTTASSSIREKHSCPECCNMTSNEEVERIKKENGQRDICKIRQVFPATPPERKTKVVFYLPNSELHQNIVNKIPAVKQANCFDFVLETEDKVCWLLFNFQTFDFQSSDRWWEEFAPLELILIDFECTRENVDVLRTYLLKTKTPYSGKIYGCRGLFT